MDRRFHTALTYQGPYYLTLNKRQPILVEQLFAAGCSTLIYQARCGNKEIVLRELCPQGLNEQGLLTRQPDGCLHIAQGCSSMSKWHQERKRFARAVWLNLRMQRHPRLNRWVIPLEGLYYRNGTLYAPTKTPAGIPLLSLSDASVHVILAAAVRILEMTQEIHRFGWILVDIKVSNFVLFPLADGRKELRLTDLDSAVSLRRLVKQRRFLCSNETAPPELLENRVLDVGPHSDVYSIAVMLLSALARKPLHGNPRLMFWNNVAPALLQWQPDSIRRLENLLLNALSPQPSQRLPDCQVMLDELIQICKKEAVDIESIFA